MIKEYKKFSVEVKASFAYIICDILAKCFAIFTVPFFTRIMSTEEYGMGTVYTSAMSIVMVFTTLQLQYGTLSTAMVKYKDDRYGYLSTICVIISILTICCLGVSYVFKDVIYKNLGLSFFFMVIMELEIFFLAVKEAWLGKLRFEFKYLKVVSLTLVSTVGSALVSIVSVILSRHKGAARICSNAVVNCVIGSFLYVFILKKGKKPFERKFWKFALSFNIPLIPYYLAQVVFNQSDRLMINKFCGMGDTAAYDIAYLVATILLFALTSIHNSYVPWIYKKIDNKNFEGTKKISLLISSVVAFALVVIIAVAPEIIWALAGDKYMKSIWIVPPVAMSLLLWVYAGLFDCFLFFFEAKVFLAFSAVLSAVVNIILNYIFIPRFGSVAAAYTTLLSYIVLVFVDYIYMIKLCKKNSLPTQIYNIKALLILFLGFLLIGFAEMSVYNYPLIRYCIIGIALISLIIFRKKCLKMFNIIKNMLLNKC